MGDVRPVTKGLRSLLRMLMHSDSFAISSIKIQTGAEHPFNAKKIFVNFDEISEEHIGKWRGYWGMISHADSNIEWLNTANENNVSILVSDLKNYITNTFKIKTSEDLTGAAILVFGKLFVSKSDKKKWYIKVRHDNTSHIFIKITK